MLLCIPSLLKPRRHISCSLHGNSLLTLRLVVTSPTTLPCWPCHFALSCRLLLTNRALSRSYDPQQSTTFAAAVLLWTCIAHFVDVLAIVVTSHMPFHIVLAQSSPHCNAPTKLSQRTSPSTIVEHQTSSWRNLLTMIVLFFFFFFRASRPPGALSTSRSSFSKILSALSPPRDPSRSHEYPPQNDFTISRGKPGLQHACTSSCSTRTQNWPFGCGCVPSASCISSASAPREPSCPSIWSGCPKLSFPQSFRS